MIFLMSVISVSILHWPGQFPLTSQLIHSSWLHVKAFRRVIDMWMVLPVFFFFFIFFDVNPFSCWIQRHTSCSNLQTILVKLLSQLLVLIETHSLWLWQSSNHSSYAVMLPPAGSFGPVPCCCGIVTRCHYWKDLPPNDHFYYMKCQVITNNYEIWHKIPIIQYLNTYLYVSSLKICWIHFLKSSFISSF